MSAVVKERTGLGKNHQRPTRQVLERRGRLAAIQVRQVSVEVWGVRPLVDELQVGSHLLVRAGTIRKASICARDRLVRERELAARHHAHLFQLADGLSRGGHHGANAVDLVTKELHANGRRRLRRIHIDGVAMNVKRARHVCGTRIGIAHAHE